MSKKIDILIDDSKEFEFAIDGNITKITIETTKGEYIIDKIKPKKKISRKDLNDLFADLF